MLDRFYLGEKITARADARMQGYTVKGLFHRFTYEKADLTVESGEENAFVIGETELPEIPDGCEYFHLGFDESHIHNKSPMLRKRLPYYMSRLTNEVCKEGKRPMIWMDLLLPPDAFVNMRGNEHSVKSRQECISIIQGLAKNTVFIDWEYSVKKAPISSVVYFKDLGIDIMGASWFDVENAYAHIDTVKDNNLFGFMQTTWDAITRDLPSLIPISQKFGAALPPWANESAPQMILATLLRGVTLEKTDYLSCGWVKRQV